MPGPEPACSHAAPPRRGAALWTCFPFGCTLFARHTSSHFRHMTLSGTLTCGFYVASGGDRSERPVSISRSFVLSGASSRATHSEPGPCPLPP